ncbi:MAG: NUDIX domain-containing protein [Candidatus Endonucleobacter bathymodioli]|uniref:ADP-ribose pyrophosphatase n=1 Tax=Candidatus Endonucleibacter bathymodioli TaxID=539814 RepID=A0AA90SLR7_9GAMM|nr:NUDIX domain-containing protein [Candidatus Endonucleobacter bathymodioli]
MKLSGLVFSDIDIEKKSVLSDGFMKLWRYRLRHRLFNGKTSELLEREVIVRPPSVGVMLYDPVKTAVILVEQFRIGPFISEDDPWLLEVVAGISDPGESLDGTAYREVLEETNCQLIQLIPIMDFYMTPGGSNERMKLYCGIADASDAEGVFGVEKEGEDIKVHVIPLDEAYSMVEDGRIANASTVIAIQWLKLNHREITTHVKI